MGSKKWNFIVGIDIWNATTETLLQKLMENIKSLGSGIEKTTGIKGTKENTRNASQSLHKPFEKLKKV